MKVNRCYLFLMLFVAICSANAQTVTVGKKQFNSIQEAINKSKPGSVIEIKGLFRESLKLNKKGITLRGEDPLEDVIEGVSGPVVFADGQYGAEDLNFENLTIRGGTSTENPGGGLSLKRVKGIVNLNNLIITRNKSDKAAGGVFIAASKVNMEKCWIHENYAAEFAGGVLLQSGNAADSEIVIRSSVISSNTGGNHGGGVYVNGNPKWGDDKNLNVTLENTIVTYNSTAKRGGAIFIKGARHTVDGGSNTTVKITHATMAYNRSTAEKGRLPGVAFYGAEGEEPVVSIVNSLIVLNGEETEPDVHFAKSSMTDHSSNIYGKLMGLKVADVDMTTSRVVNSRVKIGLSDQLTMGKGKMPVLRLSAGSIAIDQADTDKGLPTDINGKSRDIPDVGALEFE